LRLAFLQIHDAPYRMDFLRCLAVQEDVELTVYTYQKQDLVHSYWALGDLGYASCSLGAAVRIGPSLLHFRLLNPFFLRSFDMVAVMAHSHITSLLAYFWCLVWGIPYVYMADTVWERISSLWARSMKAVIYQRAAFLFVPGAVSARFFARAYGIAPDKVMMGYYNFSYAKIKAWAEAGRIDRLETRRALKVNAEDELSIMVANFLPFRKQLGLIQSFNFSDGQKLILVGEGTCLAECKTYVEKNKLDHRVIFIPGLPFEKMVKLLVACDVYVHSGKEPYSTMPLLAKLVGLRLGRHGDIPAYADVGEETWAEKFDAHKVAVAFADRCRIVRSKQ